MDALTAEEFAALRILAQRRIWNVPLDDPAVGVWELEALDRRGWVLAREVEPTLDRAAWGQPVGPWFRPFSNERHPGRPAWPQIVHAHRKAARTNRDAEPGRQCWLIAQIRLSGSAPDPFGGLDSLAATIAAPTPIQAVAEALGRVSAEWRLGDWEALDCCNCGVDSASGLFEELIRDGARSGVRRLIRELDRRLIPAVTHELSSGILEELRRLALDLDPDSVGEDQYGDRSPRWRHTWSALGGQPRIESLVPLLLRAAAMPAHGAQDEEDKRSPKVGGYTAKELRDEADARGVGFSASKFRDIRKAAGLPGGTQHRTYSNAEIRRLAKTAEAGRFRHGPSIARAWRSLFGDETTTN